MVSGAVVVLFSTGLNPNWNKDIFCTCWFHVFKMIGDRPRRRPSVILKDHGASVCFSVWIEGISRVWTHLDSKIAGSLTVKQERSNPYDCFAIVCTTRLPASISDTIVGHLPNEISRYTFFFITMEPGCLFQSQTLTIVGHH